MKILVRLSLVLLFALILDSVTKIWAERTLEPFQPVPVINDYVRLTLGYNTGVAFGMFANGGAWPLIVTGVIIVGLVIWFSRALYTGGSPTSSMLGLATRVGPLSTWLIVLF
jgi:signal peptidase II